MIIIAEFQQRYAGWVWEHIDSENKFIFSNCEK